MSDGVEIVPITASHTEGFWRALDEVARERQYLLFVEGPRFESTVEFVESNVANGVPQFVALAGDTVVGWCDISPHARTGMEHYGVLGMGVVAAYREKGVGSRLLAATLEAAEARGITRVEAEVFASNTRAIALYRKLGFTEEGLKRRARYLDSRWEDFVIMARFASGESPQASR